MTARKRAIDRPVSKTWQAVLEEFAKSTEPQTWELPHLRISDLEKFEATAYLVEKGLLRQAGRVRNEYNDTLYEATQEGRFVWQCGFTDIRRRARTKERPAPDPSLAERTVKVAHRWVFDLVTKPWTFSLREEEMRNFPLETLA
jgi:hypothetical protein